MWDLTKEDKKSSERRPVLLRSVRIQHGQRPHPVRLSVALRLLHGTELPQVSSVALTSNLSHLAIGLGDGTVLLYRHFLQSLTTSSYLTSLPKARVVHESHEPVTGLGFCEHPPTDKSTPSRSSSSHGFSLFIVTTNRVLSAPVNGKGEARTIDDVGCALGCATMDSQRKEMVVARDEAIYLYGPDGRGACLAYEGKSLQVDVDVY